VENSFTSLWKYGNTWADAGGLRDRVFVGGLPASLVGPCSKSDTPNRQKGKLCLSGNPDVGKWILKVREEVHN